MTKSGGTIPPLQILGGGTCPPVRTCPPVTPWSTPMARRESSEAIPENSDRWSWCDAGVWELNPVIIPRPPHAEPRPYPQLFCHSHGESLANNFLSFFPLSRREQTCARMLYANDAKKSIIPVFPVRPVTTKQDWFKAAVAQADEHVTEPPENRIVTWFVDVSACRATSFRRTRDVIWNPVTSLGKSAAHNLGFILATDEISNDSLQVASTCKCDWIRLEKAMTKNENEKYRIPIKCTAPYSLNYPHRKVYHIWLKWNQTRINDRPSNCQCDMIARVSNLLYFLFVMLYRLWWNKDEYIGLLVLNACLICPPLLIVKVIFSITVFFLFFMCFYHFLE